MHPAKNQQIRTRFADEGKTKLVTELVTSDFLPLGAREILVEMLYVPMHGSFWLATHPDGLHPRKKEFMEAGSFVFGNGGVGRVVEISKEIETEATGARRGDFVAIFGHLPCENGDCHGCRELGRYTECNYGEGKIIGHGKGAPDGTYAEYTVLLPEAYEICFRRDENPSEGKLAPFMYAFLVADVRNALTRNPSPLARGHVLIFGAGQSGHIAAQLLIDANPNGRIVVVDPSADRLKSIASIKPRAIATYQLETSTAENRGTNREVVAAIAKLVADYFSGKKCDLVFDASSGNAAPLWDNTQILSPGCLVIPFGFGSQEIILSKESIQLSGLTVSMSRGVGNAENRRAVIEYIKTRASEFLRVYLKESAERFGSLPEAIAFINAEQHPPKPLHNIPQAFITPNPLHKNI
jgi:threonine dehydrogenase-like Zn-dependent dehydrogenase